MCNISPKLKPVHFKEAWWLYVHQQMVDELSERMKTDKMWHVVFYAIFVAQNNSTPSSFLDLLLPDNKC